MPTLTIFQAVEFSAYLGYSGWVGARTPLANFQHQIALPLSGGLLQNAQTLWETLRSAWPILHLELTDNDGLTAQITNNQITILSPGHFSAAHRTYAPRLTEAENRALYGKCANLHGHNYRAEVALPPDAPWPTSIWDEFDHVNLSTDIPALLGRNVVTEALAELIARRAPEARWVRVWELPDFFAEYHRAEASYRLGRQYPWRGGLKIEVTVRGELDPRTETAYDLGQLDAQCLAVIQKLDYTSANSILLIQDIWTRLADRLGPALTSVQVWETRRQRFCLSE